LLVPGDFGLVALAAGFLGVIESFAELGFDLALVQRQTTERSAYDTTWTLNVIRGFLVAAVLIAIADAAADFYGDPRLAVLMRWLALGPLMAGLQNVGTVEYHRDLRFDMEFRLAVWSKAGAFCVTILLALWRRDYWALAAGILAGKAIASALSYVIHSYRPRLSLRDVRRFLHFSVWLSVNNVITGIKSRLDTFVVGKFVGPSLLGAYSVGYEISNLIASEVMWPISRVVFSGFAKMSGKSEDLARGLIDVLGLLFLVATPMAVGIGLTAEYIVRIFLGSQWLVAIPLIRILVIFGILNFATSNSQAIYLALGRPDRGAIASLPAAILLPPLLLWGTARYGLTGAAWAVVIDGAINLAMNLALMRRLIPFSLTDVFAVVWRPVIATSVMVAAIAAIDAHWVLAQTMVGLVGQFSGIVICGALVYVAMLLALWRATGMPNGPETQALAALRTIIPGVRQRG
jgi:O-antigen/teichoic acid export membrane protein